MRLGNKDPLDKLSGLNSPSLREGVDFSYLVMLSLRLKEGVAKLLRS